MNLAGFDWTKTVISQYANSPNLLGLLQDFSDCVDPSANLDAFYDLIWNVDTAIGYGLDVWGRIVGVGRVLTLTTGDFLAFQESGRPEAEFGQSQFYGGIGFTQNYTLSDDAYRQLILAKALANITDGSIRSINQILLNLFGQGYVVDNQDMTMVYTFTDPLTPVQLAIISQSGAFPRPTGVAVTVSAP